MTGLMTSQNRPARGAEPAATDRIRPERITELAVELSSRLDKSLERIDSINEQSRVLSLNAQIEASRSGTAGRAFGVVALEMRQMSHRTTDVAADLSAHVRSTANQLESISICLANQVRGIRLSDLALNNIDLIDRNLYERSCDCRWWATDPSLVNALTSPTPEALQYASKRLGQILDSYTVYLDLVLADAQGTIIANGRPGRYAAAGSNHASSLWFRSAMATRSGQEFGFEPVHASSLVDRQRVLVYSCGVRAGGEVDGELQGVLGIVFNWDALAQTIVDRTPLYDDERTSTRVCICDSTGQVLAEAGPQVGGPIMDLPGRQELFQQRKSFALETQHGQKLVLAHAQAPGFETYTTGWHSLIVQESN
jgi:hypothetical protein